MFITEKEESERSVLQEMIELLGFDIELLGTKLWDRLCALNAKANPFTFVGGSGVTFAGSTGMITVSSAGSGYSMGGVGGSSSSAHLGGAYGAAGYYGGAGGAYSTDITVHNCTTATITVYGSGCGVGISSAPIDASGVIYVNNLGGCSSSSSSCPPISPYVSL